MLKNRIEYIILLLIVSGLYIFTNQYYAIIMLLLLIILPVLSLILLTLAKRNITVDFSVPPIIKKSQAEVIDFTLNNSSAFPVSGAMIYILCRNNLTGKEENTKAFCSINLRRTNNITFSIEDANSGQITVVLKN